MYSNQLARFSACDPYNIVFEKDSAQTRDEALAVLNGYITQPQIWNRYTYVANNPIKYVDPSGEILELTGDERDRNTAFAHIKKAVGEKAAANLAVVERDGRYFVEYSGTNNSMWATDQMAGIVADLIDSTVSNEMQIAYSNTVTDANGNTHSLTAQGGAVTVPVSGSRTQIFISYNSANIADGVGHRDANGQRLTNNSATVTGHELGHAWGIQRDDVFNRITAARKEWGEWFSGTGSSRGGKEKGIVDGNNATAVMVENIVRDRLKLPRKQRHQP